jgi:uncharacterized protein
MFLSIEYFIFMIPAILLVTAAQLYVNSTFGKWSKVRNGFGLTGSEAAERLLRYGGLSNVQMETVRGRLGDHYDPRTRTLRLSPAVAGEASVAALAVAAHEIGHALQHREEYFPLQLRAALVPAVNIGSILGWIFIFLGLFLGMVNIAWLGVGAFSLSAVFALATLPVEFNASSRAQALLAQSGLMPTDQERRGVRAVLNAAALTYVAALAAALLQLLYYVTLVAGLGGRRR